IPTRQAISCTGGMSDVTRLLDAAAAGDRRAAADLLPLVYDGSGEIRFYVDGQLQNRTPIQGVKHSDYPLALGGNVHGADEGSRFLGRMNEVRISTVARYDADFTPARRFEPDEKTIALYHLDEGEGTVLNDSSGNRHHGEIVGAKWVEADGSPVD